MDARNGGGRHALPRHAGDHLTGEVSDEPWQEVWWRVWSPGAARAVALALLVLVFLSSWWWWQGRPRSLDPAPPVEAGEVITPGIALDPSTGGPLGTADPLSSATVTVHVAGRVRKPGIVTLPAGARVADAIAAAGGLRADAGGVQVNLAALLVDGERLEVRRGNQAQSSGARGAEGVGASGLPAQTTIININTATASQLETLPGVGPVLAGRIISWRELNGVFPSVETLGEVAGIGPVLMENLRPLIAV